MILDKPVTFWYKLIQFFMNLADDNRIGRFYIYSVSNISGVSKLSESEETFLRST